MKKILLIEDDPNMRENTAEILELANYNVLKAVNGKQGLKTALEDKPDLILCDIMMPVMDGYEVLHILSHYPRTAGIPFIFLTAKSGPSDMRKGMSMGADDYIVKPYDEEDLLLAIETRLKKSELFRKDYDRNVEGFQQFLSDATGLEELKKLPGNRKIIPVKKKGILFMEGDEAGNVLFISQGKIKTHKLTSDGKELITGLHGPGDFIGAIDMLENSSYKESAVAMENSEVILIPKQDFYALLYSNHDVAIRFIHLLSNSMEEMEERLLDIAFHSVRKRVADMLLKLRFNHNDKEKSDIISISRTDLSGIVGISPETVSRTLSEFRQEKLIEFRNKDIVVLNEGGLSNMKD